MNQKTVLITGCSRGIGLELVKQYANEGWHVVATYRSHSDALELFAKSHPNVSLKTLDITNPRQRTELANSLSGTSIDLLIHNAGFWGDDNQSLEIPFNQDSFCESFLQNCIAPLMLTQNIIPLMKQGQKIIACLSSQMGSIEDNDSGGYYAYRASKAALNAAFKSVSRDLETQDFRVLLLHPGWVQTDMGGPSATLDVKSSVTGLRQVIEQARKLSGMFFNHQGQILPW
jgi:NAD(P)-dependent dehydrogenase (short-subunit alcohol dehydrogenase family)